MTRLHFAAAALCLMPAACCAPAAPGRIETPAAAARFNLDTPLDVLEANRKARRVLVKDLPGLFEHPSYPMFKGMSLRQIQPYSQERMSPALMAKIEADLAAIK